PCVMGWSASPSTSTTLPSFTVRYMPHPTGWSPGGDQAHVRHLTTPSPQSIILSDITSPLVLSRPILFMALSPVGWLGASFQGGAEAPNQPTGGGAGKAPCAAAG